mmetsp:Transcript_16106/g.41453  ORF Transcript_16106/g.41453 Transcript_16106/m.41453 type:complete len:98 (+) Transcript_16106:50-343(+)
MDAGSDAASASEAATALASTAVVERVYDTVLLSEMDYVEEERMYYYSCPCGDMFEISEEDLTLGVTIAKCPSCSLKIRVDIPLGCSQCPELPANSPT